MIPDPDVYQAARLLIEQDGEAAADTARQRASGFLSKHDHVGYQAWQMIASAIEEWQRKPDSDERLN